MQFVKRHTVNKNEFKKLRGLGSTPGSLQSCQKLFILGSPIREDSG